MNPSLYSAINGCLPLLMTKKKKLFIPTIELAFGRAQTHTQRIHESGLPSSQQQQAAKARPTRNKQINEGTDTQFPKFHPNIPLPQKATSAHKKGQKKGAYLTACKGKQTAHGKGRKCGNGKHTDSSRGRQWQYGTQMTYRQTANSKNMMDGCMTEGLENGSRWQASGIPPTSLTLFFLF
jgi:hypothetical protein